MKCCCNKDECKTCKCWPVIVLVILALAGFGGYKLLTKPDERTTVERAADAVKALPNGIDAAKKELEDRTPVEQMQNKLKEIAK